jgi:hypothetical protein
LGGETPPLQKHGVSSLKWTAWRLKNFSKQSLKSLRFSQKDKKAYKLFVTLSGAKGLDSSVAYRLPQHDN